MKRLIIIIVTAAMQTMLHAQGTISGVLQEIEENNTTLKALREAATAQKLENRTDILLPDPEIGFNYLWGSPSPIGNRTDINVSQSFDIATVSGLKGKVADKKNEMIDWQYKADRMNLLLEAKQHCIDLIYYNALLKELYARRTQAQAIEQAQKKRLDSGDGNALEYNNVKLGLASVDGEIARMEAERNGVLSQLTRLNGGKPVELTATEFESVQLPTDFVSWYEAAEAKNPVLAYVRQEAELGKKQLSLNKSMSLPSFSAGYMSEKTAGEHFQGITLGISVPLWSNKNRVRQAKAAIEAAEVRREDARIQFYGNLENLYHRVAGLKAAADTYRSALQSADNRPLLQKALDAGEISVIDYLVDTGFYYDAVSKALDAEREYAKAYAELCAVEL